MQHPATKKVEGLTEKPIINYCLTEISSIISKLLATVEKRYDVWDYVKFESLPAEFDKQKAYILANKNIILKETATFLASNKIQIFRDYTSGLEIEAIPMTTKIKQGQLKLFIVGKIKLTSAILTMPIEDVEY